MQIRRTILLCTLLLCGCGLMQERQVKSEAAARRPPNIVIIFTDDQGYGDIGCFGSKIATPNLDRMATEGMRLTDFYTPQPVCSSSRAALLTGCYSNRVGIVGALFPTSKHGINSDETTMAEVLKARGYATAAYGKWHLGHLEPFLPTHHGFDEYIGVPYSNDMWRRKPVGDGKIELPLPVYNGTEVIEQIQDDQSHLTTLYTESAVKFIEKNKDEPFFVYLAHSMPHIPLYVSEKFRGKSDQGIYGDVIMEIDWSVGQVLDALKRTGVDDNTLVIFTTDNGPWIVFGDHGGSNGGLREGKMTCFEGGVRVPFIARWPGHIPAGSASAEPVMTIDLLPTLAHLSGGSVPTDRIIDGRNIWPILAGEPGAKSPHEVLYFYWHFELHALRSGKWKYHVKHPYRTVEEAGSGGRGGRMKEAEIGPALYDMEADPGETTNLVEKYPEVAARMEQYAAHARADLGDSLTEAKGANRREPGRVE